MFIRPLRNICVFSINMHDQYYDLMWLYQTFLMLHAAKLIQRICGKWAAIVEQLTDSNIEEERFLVVVMNQREYFNKKWSVVENIWATLSQ